jgi:hypothetical protein
MAMAEEGRNKARTAALGAFCLAVAGLVPLKLFLLGGLAWILALLLVLRDPEASFRRRMGVLLGLVLLLAVAPIHTDTGTRHFITLGSCFLLALVGPTLVLGRSDPGTIRWNLLPQRFRLRDVIYVIVSFPLAWGILQIYFFHINPELPAHWKLPPAADHEQTWRLILGINCVGIWDELFFINTVYGILRSVFPRRLANLGQAVVYASVLSTMAFTGIGPVVVFLFALTQGAMYEGSRALIYVLFVHLVIDFFLVSAILHFYYPMGAMGVF